MACEMKQVAFNKNKALEFLRGNSMNRSIRDNKVAQIALEMKSGRWNEEYFDPVLRAADGYILNGQHRLWAIVLAEDITIKLYVIENADPAMMAVVDAGTPRSLVDRLRLSKSLPPYIKTRDTARMYSGAVRYFFCFPVTHGLSQASWTNDTVSQASNMVSPHIRFAFNSLANAQGSFPDFLRLAGLITAIARAHACKVGEEILIAFCAVLKDGQNSPLRKEEANKYVRTVREWILQKKYCRIGGAGKTDALCLYLLVTRAIQCFEADSKLSNILIKPEDIYPRSTKIIAYLKRITPDTVKMPSFNKLNARLVEDGIFDGRV